MEILGIDIGGSGIKGATVDIHHGTFTQERYRIVTPQPATPDAVAEVVAQIVHHFRWQGPVGCTFPAVVKHGVTLSAANVDDAWIGMDAQTLMRRRTECPLVVLNDADAAGLAEMTFGAGVGRGGVIIILTFGTGIGSAVFVNGALLPNTEFGHMQIHNGKEVEKWASDLVRKEKQLGWKKWAKRINEYMSYLEMLLTPDLFIVGGGVSKKHDEFLPLLELQTPVLPAQLLNDAGIVGAALAARELVGQ